MTVGSSPRSEAGDGWLHSRARTDCSRQSAQRVSIQRPFPAIRSSRITKTCSEPQRRHRRPGMCTGLGRSVVDIDHPHSRLQDPRADVAATGPSLSNSRSTARELRTPRVFGLSWGDAALRAPRQTEKRFVIGRQRVSKPARRSTMVSSRRLGALPWSGRREFLKVAAAAAAGVACRPWPAGRAIDRRTVGRSGSDPPPYFPADLSCARVRHHSIRCHTGSRRRRDRRLSRRHQRLPRRRRRPRHRPGRTLRHRADRVAVECQPPPRRRRGGRVHAAIPAPICRSC